MNFSLAAVFLGPMPTLPVRAWIWIEAAGGTSAADSTFSVAYEDDHLFRLFRWRHPFFTHSALFGEKGRAVRELGDIHIYRVYRDYNYHFGYITGCFWVYAGMKSDPY